MVVVEAVVLVHRHPVAVAVALADLLVQRLADVEQLGRPGDVEVPGAADGDRLQPLVAHDHADAARRAGVVVVDGSHVDPVFAGEADGRHLDALVLQFLLQQVLRFGGAFAAQVRGVADLHLVVVDVQVDQVRRLAA